MPGETQLLSVPYALYANSSGSPGGGDSSHWSGSNGNIYNTNPGNIGVGTALPIYNLDIHSSGNAQLNLTEGTGFRTATFSRYTNRLEIEPSDAFQVSVGGIAVPHFWVGSNGNVGIGTTTPLNKLHVSGGDIRVESDNAYLITNSTVANNYCGVNMRVQDNSKAWMYWDNTNSVLNLNTAGDGLRNDLTINPSGNVGIGTNSPADKLSVSNGYIRDEGTNPFFYECHHRRRVWWIRHARENNPRGWMYWNDYFSVLQLSTDPTAARPDLTVTGSGAVGIGTSAPIAPFDVETAVAYDSDPDWDAYTNGGFRSNLLSIHANGDILAQALVAFSDGRIKESLNTSNSKRDLELLNRLKVTDYTMKDKIMFGDKHYKKIIAQQVEQVYPQVVNKITNFIPNVYQKTFQIENTAGGYLLTFSEKHNISPAAKKLKIENAQFMQIYEITAIPSDYQVLVKGSPIGSHAVFVYGEQVDYFRTVDYDGLMTLNISATQELSKKLRQESEMIELLKDKIDHLERLNPFSLIFCPSR